jgi:biopolymer transport protein ExbB
MLEIFQKGGPMMWLLLLASITLLGTFLERLIFFHRITIHTGEFLRGLANLVERGHLGEAVEECATTPGPVAQVAHAVLLRHRAPVDELRVLAREAGQLELPKLERHLPLLVTLAYVTPLLGLLGTVLGLLDAFLQISAQGGYATTAEIAGGVYQSLISTGAALAVAIPAYVAFSYLSARVDGFVRDMERTGIEIVQMVRQNQEKAAEKK